MKQKIFTSAAKPADRPKKTKAFEKNFEWQIMDKKMQSDLKAF